MPAALPEKTDFPVRAQHGTPAAAFRTTRELAPWILLGIALLAFGLRWAAVALHPQEGHFLHHDSPYYMQNAWSILTTGLPALGDNEAPLGFSYLLLVVFALGGHLPFIAYVLQPLAGAVVCLLLYFLCRQLGHPVAGLIAAAIATVHPTLINSASQILTEPWASIFILSSLLAAGTRRKPMLLLAGFLMGFACIIRAPTLAVLVGLPLWWILRDPAQGFRRAAPFLLMGFLPIAAVSVHLSVASHQPVFLTLQSHEASTVRSVSSGFLEVELEEQQERGGYFEYASRHPMRFVQERFFSFINFVSPWPMDDDRSLLRKILVAICDGIVLLAALAAAVMLWKQQPRSECFLLLWLPCCLCLFYTAFFSIPRYRVTSLPMLIAFSSLVLVPRRSSGVASAIA